LTRARDFVDAHYADSIGVEDMAAAAGQSRSHFTREFTKVFGETPGGYLLTRRLERAAWLLRMTDHSVASICFDVGLKSVGSFTSSFTRTFGMSPVAYRDSLPPAAAMVRIPLCVYRIHGRPQRVKGSTNKEDPQPLDRRLT
jgi:AraC-like DNA-binding protein